MSIKKFGFVATPKSSEELTEYASRLNDKEKEVFIIGVCMTWNLLADMIEEEYHSEK